MFSSTCGDLSAPMILLDEKLTSRPPWPPNIFKKDCGKIRDIYLIVFVLFRKFSFYLDDLPAGVLPLLLDLVLLGAHELLHLVHLALEPEK